MKSSSLLPQRFLQLAPSLSTRTSIQKEALCIQFFLSLSSIVMLQKFYQFLVDEDKRTHQQGDVINKMKRRENLRSKPGGSQPTLKIDREEKKKW